MSDVRCKIINTDGMSVLCNMKFEGNIVISNLTDFTISNHTIATNTMEVSEPNNTLIDDDNENRFIFLFNGLSSYSAIEYAIYYDNITKNIFMINNPDYIDVSNMNNNYVNLYGYLIGSVDSNNGDGLSLINRVNDLQLPEPVGELDTVDIIELNLHGINTRFSFMNSKQIDTEQSGYLPINLNAFIKVDKKVLFGEDVKLPMYNIHPSTMIKFNTKYIGKLSTDYIYIPIPV